MKKFLSKKWTEMTIGEILIYCLIAIPVAWIPTFVWLKWGDIKDGIESLVGKLRHKED